MVANFFKHDPQLEPKDSRDASNSGLRGTTQLNVNGAGWTGRSGNDTVLGSDVGCGPKVLSSMQGNIANIERPVAVKPGAEKPTSNRKQLDTFHHGNFSLGLFYEGKGLCLELRDESSNALLAKWAFCIERRHERLFHDEDFTVRVCYRPAAIEVAFVERGRKGFIKRWLASSLKSKDTWSAYELKCDGSVQINRPNKEYCVS